MVKIKIIVLLLIIASIMSSSYKFIEIPFSRRELTSSSLSVEENYRILEENKMKIEIQLGSPYQKLYLSPQLEKHFSYVIGEGATFDGNTPKDLVEFKYSQSSSFKQLEKYDYSSILFYSAYLMKDNAKIGGKEIKDLQLIEALQFRNARDMAPDSGVLGFAPVDSMVSYTSAPNLIKNLFTKKIINSYKFFLKYDTETSGRIILGGEPYDFDSNRYQRKISKVARIPSYGSSKVWGFTVDEIKYNGVEVKGTFPYKYTKFLLNCGFIILPQPIKTLLDDQFFKVLVDDGTCFEPKSSGGYVCKKGQFDSSKLGVLSLYNMELYRTFDLDISKMFYDIGDYSYFLVQFRNSTPIILGAPFLRDNIFMMNQDENMVGYFEDLPAPSNKGLIIAIVIITIVAIIVICYLLFMIFKIHKKFPRLKRGGEIIDDNYEYLPKNI